MHVSVSLCVYTSMSSEMCFLVYTEKAFCLRSHRLCVFFFLTEGRFVHSLHSITSKKSSTFAVPFFFLLMPRCYTFTLSSYFVTCNACKSNPDLKVNLQEFLKEIYREENWMAPLIQRWLMALLSTAGAEGVCVLTDIALEDWAGAGTCLGALVPAFPFCSDSF